MTQQAQVEALRALAAAADKHGQHFYTHPRDSNAWQANDSWCKTVSPELVIGLLDRIAALKAQQAEPTRKQIEDYLFQQGSVLIDKETYEAMRRPAAPLAQARKPLTDGEIIATQESLIAAKDELYRSRIGLKCSHCKTGTYRADGNGYHDFHRCNECRHVPMWNLDGKEFNGVGTTNAN